MGVDRRGVLEDVLKGALYVAFLTMFAEISLAASLTMFLTLLLMLFSTAFLFPSLQLSLGLLLDETYRVVMTVNVY